MLNTTFTTNLKGLFQLSSSLTNIDIDGFNTSKVTNLSYMFYYCYDALIIDLRSADFTTVTIYSGMFTSITNGINIIVKDATAQTFITARLTNASRTGTVTIY